MNHPWHRRWHPGPYGRPGPSSTAIARTAADRCTPLERLRSFGSKRLHFDKAFDSISRRYGLVLASDLVHQNTTGASMIADLIEDVIVLRRHLDSGESPWSLWCYSSTARPLAWARSCVVDFDHGVGRHAVAGAAKHPSRRSIGSRRETVCQGGKSHISKSTMAVGVVTTILGVLVVIWSTASIIVVAGGCDVRSAHTVLSPGSAISNSSAKARAARDSASSRMPTW